MFMLTLEMTFCSVFSNPHALRYFRTDTETDSSDACYLALTYLRQILQEEELTES